MSRFRCWQDGHAEPHGFDIEALYAEAAAAEYVRSSLRPDARELADEPILILVRQDGSMRVDPHRVRVTASIEVSIWAYPDREGVPA